MGVLNDTYEAVIVLTVTGPSGQAWEVEAVIDTGFTGFLSLPSGLVTELELPFLTNESAESADGSLVSFNVHDALVLWDGESRRVYAEVTDATPLVCMRMLDGYDLSIQVQDGSRVVIRVGE